MSGVRGNELKTPRFGSDQLGEWPCYLLRIGEEEAELVWGRNQEVCLDKGTLGCCLKSEYLELRKRLNLEM